MNPLLEALSYHSDAPLLFTQVFFWVFLLVVLLGYALVYDLQKHKRGKILFLLLASGYFYYKTSGIFLILLGYVTVVDFFLARKIYYARTPARKKLWLTLSVTHSMLLLSYFKYSQFLVESLNSLLHTSFAYVNHFSLLTNALLGTTLAVDKIIFPVGISFFLFQTLSYAIDVYQGKITPLDNIIDYGFYIAFFPSLVAGPIIKARDFLYQIHMPYQLSAQEFKHAWLLIMKGLAKKIFADYLALQLVDKIFDNPSYFTSYENFLAILGYSYQIYADFSGYTDIAIGVALLLGFRIKKNFDYPYKAQSPSEFWKRWHISLSSWLKEYLYIPLGGNREVSLASYLLFGLIGLFLGLLIGNLAFLLVVSGGFMILVGLSRAHSSFRRFFERDINIMVTMLLGGLWHGSSWLFLVWGGLNGLAVVAHKYWEKISPFRNTSNQLIQFTCMMGTLLFISWTRIFFRSPSWENAMAMNAKLFSGWELDLMGSIHGYYKEVLVLLGVLYFLHWMPEKWRQYLYEKVYKLPIFLLVILTCLIIFALYQFQVSESKPFIYFQF
ncbi:MAG: MBOAT family O-acyltransferase [Bacteroidia bacterium]